MHRRSQPPARLATLILRHILVRTLLRTGKCNLLCTQRKDPLHDGMGQRGTKRAHCDGTATDERAIADETAGGHEPESLPSFVHPCPECIARLKYVPPTRKRKLRTRACAPKYNKQQMPAHSSREYLHYSAIRSAYSVSSY
ncbi:hypothetical protein RJ55_07679 [Drechmeria coniospora]|nr:hypothetical protein RJ55_07679 [Drechmeria coniospora]